MRPSNIRLAAFVAAISCIAGGLFAAAHAADKGGPPAKIDALGNVKSPVTWFAGASIGANLNTTVLDDGTNRLDIGSQNYQVGVEGGFDYRLAGPFSIGGLARYDWADAKATLFGADVKYNGIWTLAGKFTYHLNPGAEVYGLLGYSGTSFKFDTLSDNKRGLMYGLGMELSLGETPVKLFAEWDRTTFKEEEILSGSGVNIKPSVDVVRVGTRIRF